MDRRPQFKKFLNKRIDLNSIYGYSQAVSHNFNNPYLIYFYPIYKYVDKGNNVISVHYEEKNKKKWEEDIAFLDDFFNIDSITL
jgi:hypothetical protein